MEMPGTLIGKRKKKKQSCPNPLFVQWLMEWGDDAAEKGLKSSYTYRKAMKTLKRYPLELTSGKECKFLENFGDKICKMLDDKLAKHIAQYGTTEPVDPDPVAAGPRGAGPANGDASLLRLPGEEDDDMGMLRVPPPPGRNTVGFRFDSDSDSSEDMLLPAGRKRKASGAKQKGPREYIPKCRSGPYALIISLYNNLQNVESRRFMTKKELMREAQPLADKSFTIPDPGCRYTAWSSMGSLIQKGYVIKESSPAKYSLTDAGCELADRILRGEAAQGPAAAGNRSHGDAVPVRFGDGHDAAVNRLGRADFLDEFEDIPEELLRDDDDDMLFKPEERVAMDTSFSDELRAARLKFWYISEGGDTVMQKDKAAVLIDEEICIGFLVKTKHEDLLMSGKRYKMDVSRGATGEYIYAYIQDSDADETANPPTANQAMATTARPDVNHNTGYYNRAKSKVDNPAVPEADSTRFPGTGWVLQPNHQKPPPATATKLPGNASKHKPPTVTRPTAPSTVTRIPPAARPPVPSTITRIPPAARPPAPSTITRIPSAAGGLDLADIPSMSEGSQSQDSQRSVGSSVASSYVPQFSLLPGTFEIVLCADNTEIYGKGCGKDALLKELQRSHIALDVRKLQVGDFLWIARDKHTPFGGAKRELVLNYIIERKRMDDLAGSIVDGRFREQKFRMRNCGLKNQIYLVEAYGSAQNFSVPEDSLYQAVANTQVIDDFYVKRTQDSKESAAYLAMLTKQIQSIHMRKTLVGSTKPEVERYNETAALLDQEVPLMTFREFNESSVKTKANSVQEMFGKQLVQLAGITVEKAAAIVDKYPTPSSLRQAYQRCFSDAEAESLLMAVKFGPMKRGIGKAPSAMIFKLYSTDVLL